MGLFNNLSIKVKNYKCFGEEPQGFDEILPINVIIGRNNSGKSALIDIIDYVINPKKIPMYGHNGKEPEVILCDALSEDELRKVFVAGTSGRGIMGDHWRFGKQYINILNQIDFCIAKFNVTSYLY